MKALNLVGNATSRKRGRGNPNWLAKQQFVPPAEPTEFEDLLKEYKLTEENCARSFRVQRWVRKHYKRRFVPEHVLMAMRIHPEWLATEL